LIPTPYVYFAKVISVYDGDTLNLSIDLGMGISYNAKCRLEGLDTPELRSKDASEKQAAITSRGLLLELVDGKNLLVKSMVKPDKYGRLLVRIWTEDGKCVNEAMLSGGGALPYDGGKKFSWASAT
jgi:micrococcal nuclease